MGFILRAWNISQHPNYPIRIPRCESKSRFTSYFQTRIRFDATEIHCIPLSLVFYFTEKVLLSVVSFMIFHNKITCSASLLNFSVQTSISFPVLRYRERKKSLS